MKELETVLSTVAKAIVDHPDEIVVLSAQGSGFAAFEVRCADSDVGTLVGRRGAHADAIRTLLMAAGARHRMRVTVQILGLSGE